MSKALVRAFIRALTAPNHNKGYHHPVRRSGGKTPHHWHVTFFGRTKYVMSRVGFNQRGIRFRRDSWNMTAVTQKCTACPSLAAAA